MEQSKKVWGLERVTVSPFCFNSLRLRYVLAALLGVRGRVLEIGSGAGAFAQALTFYRPYLSVIRSDIEVSLLMVSERGGRDISGVAADAQWLPLISGAVDAVVAFDVLEHLADPQQAFRECFRVLKKGGVFHGAIPLEGSLMTVHGLMAAFGFYPKEHYAGHVQRFRATDVVRMARGAGFRDISVGYSGYFFFQLVDFGYFLALWFWRRNPSYTVEGYEATLKSGWLKVCLRVVRALLAGVCYLESRTLFWVPGVIGHFTLVKR